MKAYEIKGEIPNTNKQLEIIFDRQDLLMKEYIQRGIEPNHFQDFDTPQSQDWLKSTAGKLIEELAEADDNYRELTLQWDKISQKEMLPYLIDFNEEIGDVMHYMVELLQYSNIGVDDIRGYYNKLLREKDLESSFLFKDNLLKTCFTYARYCNTENEAFLSAFTMPAFQLSEMGINNDEFLMGGSKITVELEFAFHKQMWDLTYYLMQAMNCLKLRPWKKELIKTNVEKYHFMIMEAWLHFVRLLDIMNFNPGSIFTVYVKKNEVNLMRLNN